METRPERRGISDWQSAERDATVQRGRKRGLGGRRVRALRGAISEVEENFEQYVAGRTKSSGSVPFVESGFGQLSQGAAVSGRRRRTDSEGMPRSLGHTNERNLLMVSVEGAQRESWRSQLSGMNFCYG